MCWFVVLHPYRADSEVRHTNLWLPYISVRLDWPSRITGAEFFAKIAAMPKSKTYGFLSPS